MQEKGREGGTVVGEREGRRDTVAGEREGGGHSCRRKGGEERHSCRRKGGRGTMHSCRRKGGGREGERTFLLDLKTILSLKRDCLYLPFMHCIIANHLAVSFTRKSCHLT